MGKQKQVYEILIDYLKENGFDGLCGDGCGCGIDDFAPCDEDYSNCVPAYLHKKPDCDKCETKCDCYDGEAMINCYKTEKQANNEMS